jgi:hypothetical protein
MEKSMVDSCVKKIVFAAETEPVAPKQIKYEVSGGNDWTIVAKKFLGGLLASWLAIGIPYAINFLQTEDLSSLPAWFVALVPLIVASLIAANNAWNHRLTIRKVEA